MLRGQSSKLVVVYFYHLNAIGWLIRLTRTLTVNWFFGNFLIFKKLGFGHRAINIKMNFFLVALAVILSIVHSEACISRHNPGATSGIKSDILKR